MGRDPHVVFPTLRDINLDMVTAARWCAWPACLLAGFVLSQACAIKVLPIAFLSFGLLISCLGFLAKMRRRCAALSILVLSSLWGTFNRYYLIKYPHNHSADMADTATSGLALAVGVVSDISIRLQVAEWLLVEQWFGMFVLFWTGHSLFRSFKANAVQGDLLLPATLGIWAMVVSWTAWFLFLSIDFPRYYSPAVFLGNIFVAAFLERLITFYGPFLCRIRRYWPMAKRFSVLYIGSLCTLVCWIPVQVMTISVRVPALLSLETGKNSNLRRMAEFINERSSSTCIIETYDAQIFFLLNRKFRYPPDQMNVDAIRMSIPSHKGTLRYESLAGKPDFLLVGFWSRTVFPVYSDLMDLKPPLIVEFGDYALYDLRSLHSKAESREPGPCALL